MEKHRCKLCYRNFANGRALGGHMRSHMMNLYGSSKVKQEFKGEHEENINHDQQFMSEEIESVPSSSSSSDEEEEEEENEDEGLFSYHVVSTNNHNNLKRRVGMVDPDDQLCFRGVEAGGSVVLQDRESETESSKNPICRRSKRVRKSRVSDTILCSDYITMKELQEMKNPKSEEQGKIPSELVQVQPSVEAEPLSSISETSPEEDVAHCLMMLSRDKWMRRDNEEEEEEEDFFTEEADQDQEEGDREEQEKETKKGIKNKYYCHDFSVVKVTKSRSRGKYRCETCNKVFRSYQALGGHRASHKRIKAGHISNNCREEPARIMEQSRHVDASAAAAAAVSSLVEEKIHECPVCYRVFSSGQALGGHKRSHVMGAAAAAAAASRVSIIPATKPFSRFGETFIDLNLPAPIDDDDISQIELSAVSDAEFVNPFRR